MSYSFPTHNVGPFLDPKIARDIALVFEQIPPDLSWRIDEAIAARRPPRPSKP